MRELKTWEEVRKGFHFTPEEEAEMERELKKARAKIDARIKKEEAKKLKKEKKLLKSCNCTKII